MDLCSSSLSSNCHNSSTNTSSSTLHVLPVNLTCSSSHLNTSSTMHINTHNSSSSSSQQL
jgi:hypothetical protein